jgi:Uma2 family endonuclease
MNEIARTIKGTLGAELARHDPYIAELLERLGSIDAGRVRLVPPPGTATIADLVAANEARQGVCELVDGTLVEKGVGQLESWLAFIIAGQLDRYLETNDIGMVWGEAGVLRILPGIGRAGDVTYIAWTSLPGGRPPPREDAVPTIVPDLVVEVLSKSNTPGEMHRKRSEYFRAGVKQVWEIDPQSRGASVYTGVDQMKTIPAGGMLDGGDILPGFTLSLGYVFDRAERMGGR